LKMSKEESTKKFIEILNWQKYQENIPQKNAIWHKTHTSLANCEAFINLDYKDREILRGLWHLASQVGPVFKADPEYLFRKIPFIKKFNEINLDVLINATDDFGRANPFIRYVDSPDQYQKNNTSSNVTKKTYSQKRVQKKARQRDKVSETAIEPLYEKALEIAGQTGYVSANNLQKELNIGHPKAISVINLMRENGLLGKYVKCKGHEYITSSEKTETEENRKEQIREETDSYRNPEEKREKKEKTDLKGKEQNKKKQRPKTPQTEAQRQKKELLQDKANNSDRKPLSPSNPMESDESAVSSHNMPKQPTSSFRGGDAQPIGRIIKGDFKPHWSDPECDEFGGLVIGALGYSVDKTNEFSKGEWGTFTNWLFRLKGVCKSDALIEEIKQKMIKKARWVNSPKCKKPKNKGALLIHIMDGELETRGIKLPNSRASPA
jgi:hypothetical protein